MLPTIRPLQLEVALTAMPNGEVARRAMGIARPARSFQPSADDDPDGDGADFVFPPVRFYADRVDDRVTVCCSHATGEGIGSLIKGVSGFCKRVLEMHPGFRIVIDDGRTVWSSNSTSRSGSRGAPWIPCHSSARSALHARPPWRI